MLVVVVSDYVVELLEAVFTVVVLAALRCRSLLVSLVVLDFVVTSVSSIYRVMLLSLGAFGASSFDVVILSRYKVLRSFWWLLFDRPLFSSKRFML